MKRLRAARLRRDARVPALRAPLCRDVADRVVRSGPFAWSGPIIMTVARLILLLLVTMVLSGCGYRTGAGSSDSTGYRWSSLYRPDVQTVAVPIFTSTSFDRGVEIALSKAIVNHVEATTPYKVVPRDRADTVLEGQVVDVAVSPLSSDRSAGIPQEQSLSLTVDFTWKDLRSGQILVQRQGFAQTSTYYPTLGEGRFVGRQQALEKLAIGIVQELQTDW